MVNLERNHRERACDMIEIGFAAFLAVADFRDRANAPVPEVFYGG